MQQTPVKTFLDIFIIVNNHAFMPEVFTMIVNGEPNTPPTYPKNTAYKALPIGGVPGMCNGPTAQTSQKSAERQSYLTPAIFYLEEGIMLFFRIPLSDESIEALFCDNYFGPQDFINGNGGNVMPFF